VVSDDFNAKLLKKSVSRQGRLHQRWVQDTSGQNTIRLVTGCIPVFHGGKVLFLSASGKPEWIFPKGGWEQDETMEESAVRESYEEAGVIGVLGPRLGEVQYETRKARKRRLACEEMQERLKREKQLYLCNRSKSSTSSVETSTSSVEVTTAQVADSSSVEESSSTVSDEVLSRIREQPVRKYEYSSSELSDSSTYTHVRMTLFPLYVSKVKEKWPESGRFRKVVPIDEGIQMLESRPELQAALTELKERGLHLASQAELYMS